VNEVSSRSKDVETLVESLSALADRGGQDVPDWVAQDLTFGQMRILFLLSKHGPSPISRVAEWLGVGLSSASGVVDRVERHGLVIRSHRRDDRRVVECDLTDQGRRLIEDIGGMRREMLSEIVEGLSDEELADFARLIQTIIERLKTRSQ
jgi:DNA-binding MarR family transcriptional regulator